MSCAQMFEDMKRGRANSRDILPYATLLKAHAEQGDVESMASLLLELKARVCNVTDLPGPQLSRSLPYCPWAVERCF
jgi:pentatricopeptide repeat protein